MEPINVLEMKSAAFRHDVIKFINSVGTKETDPSSWIAESMRDQAYILFNTIDREIKRLEKP